jgi:hypothetical protein
MRVGILMNGVLLKYFIQYDNRIHPSVFPYTYNNSRIGEWIFMKSTSTECMSKCQITVIFVLKSDKRNAQFK